MHMPKATLIISVYNDIHFLKAVLDSLNAQTFKDFEIIVSEDAGHEHVKTFLEGYPFSNPYQHLTQEDLGWRKNRALNRAIQAAKSDYLVLIDGDCVLHPRFMEQHVLSAREGLILGGKRLKLNDTTTKAFLEGTLGPTDMNRYLLTHLATLRKEGFLYPEEGFYINPDGMLGFIPRMRTLTNLTGSNMSFSKEAILSINGFDEDYSLPAIGEDIDLNWRFKGAGYQLGSVRNLAVQYHLQHKENWINQDVNLEIMRLKQEKKQYRCLNGIVKE
jgi:cellulose synthase/poly-beta-1,6-N-acetylglucosamine synthase-like glycosyltransferase